MIEGRHADPFRYLGPHVEKRPRRSFASFFPAHVRSRLSGTDGRRNPLDAHPRGGTVRRPASGRCRRLSPARALSARAVVELDDPYRFPPVLSDLDLYLLGEGTHLQLYDKLGAHPLVHEGVAGRRLRGVCAQRETRQRRRRLQQLGRPPPCHARARQRLLGNLCARRSRAGDKYKFEILGADGELLPLKSDPVAFAAELRPQTASIVVDAQSIEPSVVGACRLQRA